MNYHCTTRIWLSMEYYHNKGLKPDRTKEIIDSLYDPCSPFGSTLRCEPMGLNHNWIVETSGTNPEDIRLVVDVIESNLRSELREAA